VRDLLHATDLARLFVALAERVEPGAGHQLNVGGGPGNSLSILELFDWLAARTGRPVDFATGPVRPSDQRIFVSANTSVSALTGWHPEVDLETGLGALLAAG
jgi:CDP-paratose 2-epimerase